jgi:hypothetical protein
MTPAERALVIAGHKEATRQLRTGKDFDASPNSFEVRAVLVEFGFDVRREAIVRWCVELKLPLADDDFADSEITRKLPTQAR